jgi:hypothetical protein
MSRRLDRANVSRSPARAVGASGGVEGLAILFEAGPLFNGEKDSIF